MQTATTGVYPWIGYRASDRLSFWTVAGYGAGGLSVHADNSGPLKTGLSMSMAAGGTRAEIAGIAGFALALKGDALWVGTTVNQSEGRHGRLEQDHASIHRIRAALEGSRTVTVGNRVTLYCRPSNSACGPTAGTRTRGAASTSRRVSDSRTP